MPFARTRPEPRLETAEKLRGERYFGHQDQTLASGFESGCDGLEINLRLAGARDAFEQGYRESAGLYTFRQNGRGVFLPGFKGWPGESRRARMRRRLGRQRDGFKRAFVDQRVENAARTGG